VTRSTRNAELRHELSVIGYSVHDQTRAAGLPS
jgi:hypothetical protein